MSLLAREEAAGTSVQRAIEGIQRLIRMGEIVPGQQIRQEMLAQRIGVSRAPIREALQALRSGGIVEHEPNVGYSVARLTVDELSQIYLMRRLLETEVLLAVEVSDGLEDSLRELNAGMADAIAEGDQGELQRLNDAFHFAIFGASRLDVVAQALTQLWSRSQAYRAIYIYDPASRRRILREHDAMAAAIGANDLKTLVRLANRHRRGGERDVRRLLSSALAAPIRFDRS